MKKYLLLIIISAFSQSLIANDSFMKDCKKLMYKDQLANLKQTKQDFADAREKAESEEQMNIVNETEQEFFDRFESHTQDVCICIKDEVASSLELMGESESDIQQNLTDLGKAMLSGYYWGINEVTRSAFQEAMRCS